MSDKSMDLPSPPQLTPGHRGSHDLDHLVDNAFSFGHVERPLSGLSMFSSVTLMDEEMRNHKKKDVPSLWETPKRSKATSNLAPISNLTPQFSKNNLSIGTVEEIYETPNSKYAKNLRSSTGFFESNGNIQWRSPSPNGSGRGTYSKYTSTLASLPTPTSAIRVSAQRRVPFSAQAYRLSNTSREKLCTDGFNKAFYEPVASSTPSPSISKGGGGNGAVDFYESILSYEVTHEYIENEEYHRCITYLSGKVFSETKRCREAQKIVLATRKQAGSRYTRNEVCAHALLLVSTCRLAMYKDLLSRINTYHRMSIGPPPVSKYVLSRVSIKEITINLLGAYILRTRKNDAQYAFMVVVSSHDRVMATEVMTVPENWALRKHHLQFNEDMNFVELPLNFQIRVEVFAMNLSDRQPTSAGKEIAKKALNFFGKCSSPLLPEEIEKQASGFKPIGHMFITRNNAGIGGKRGFFLHDNEYPLDGIISITCECTPLPPELYVVHSGYWTFICGTGNTLFWVKMVNGVIKFYDAHHKDDPHEEPTFVIDLSTICNKKVERELAQIKDEPRFAFYLDVLSFPRGCELCEHKRYLIGVENEEQLEYWLEWINTGNLVMEVRKLRSAEREAELDRKIEEIRRKNEIIEEQHRIATEEAKQSGALRSIASRPSKPTESKDSRESPNVQKKNQKNPPKKADKWDREWDKGKTSVDDWKTNVPDLGDRDHAYFTSEAENHRGRAQRPPRPPPGTKNPGYFHDDRGDAEKASKGKKVGGRRNDRNQNDTSKVNMNNGKNQNEFPRSNTRNFSENSYEQRNHGRDGNRNFHSTTEFQRRPQKKYSQSGASSEFDKKQHHQFQKTSRTRDFPKNPNPRQGQYGARKDNRNQDEKVIERIVNNLVDRVISKEKREMKSINMKSNETKKEHSKDSEAESEDSGVKDSEVKDSEVKNPPDSEAKDSPDPEIKNSQDAEVKNSQDAEVKDPEVKDSEVKNSPDSEAKDSLDPEIKNSQDAEVKDPEVKNPQDVEIKDSEIKDPPDPQKETSPGSEAKDSSPDIQSSEVKDSSPESEAKSSTPSKENSEPPISENSNSMESTPAPTERPSSPLPVLAN